MMRKMMSQWSYVSVFMLSDSEAASVVSKHFSASCKRWNHLLHPAGPSRNLLQSWNQQKRKHSFTSVMPAWLRTHVKILSFGCVTLQVTPTLIIQVVMSTCDKCLPNSQFQHHCNIVVWHWRQLTNTCHVFHQVLHLRDCAVVRISGSDVTQSVTLRAKQTPSMGGGIHWSRMLHISSKSEVSCTQVQKKSWPYQRYM